MIYLTIDLKRDKHVQILQVLLLFVKNSNLQNAILPLLKKLQNTQKFKQFLDQKTNSQNSALSIACNFGNLQLVKLLIKFGANRNCKNSQGMNLLHIAAQQGYINTLLYFIQIGFKIDQVDSNGRTPLHWACYQGHQQSVKLILSRKVQLNTKQSVFGLTALHMAVISGSCAIAYKLMIYGAEQTIVDNQGRKPFDIAVRSNFQQMPNILKQQKTCMQLIGLSSRKPINKVGIPFFFTLSWILIPLVCNLITINRMSLTLRLIFIVWSFLVCQSYYLLYKSKPGILKPRIPLRNVLSKQHNKICYQCRLQIPNRAKHCYVCGYCVKVFDHHCPWVANCIGAQNIFFFHAFLIITFSYILFNQIYSIYLIATDSSYQWVNYITLFFSLALFLVGALLGYQCNSSCRGITTFQRLSSSERPSLSIAKYIQIMHNYEAIEYDTSA